MDNSLNDSNLLKNPQPTLITSDNLDNTSVLNLNASLNINNTYSKVQESLLALQTSASSIINNFNLLVDYYINNLNNLEKEYLENIKNDVILTPGAREFTANIKKITKYKKQFEKYKNFILKEYLYLEESINLADSLNSTTLNLDDVQLPSTTSKNFQTLLLEKTKTITKYNSTLKKLNKEIIEINSTVNNFTVFGKSLERCIISFPGANIEPIMLQAIDNLMDNKSKNNISQLQQDVLLKIANASTIMQVKIKDIKNIKNTAVCKQQTNQSKNSEDEKMQTDETQTQTQNQKNNKRSLEDDNNNINSSKQKKQESRAGNCFFIAISSILYNNDSRYQEIKDNTINQLRNMVDDPKYLNLKPQIKNEIEYISVENNYAGELEFMAASMYYNLNLGIFTNFKGKKYENNPLKIQYKEYKYSQSSANVDSYLVFDVEDNEKNNHIKQIKTTYNIVDINTDFNTNEIIEIEQLIKQTNIHKINTQTTKSITESYHYLLQNDTCFVLFNTENAYPNISNSLLVVYIENIAYKGYDGVLQLLAYHYKIQGPLTKQQYLSAIREKKT